MTAFPSISVAIPFQTFPQDFLLFSIPKVLMFFKVLALILFPIHFKYTSMDYLIYSHEFRKVSIQMLTISKATFIT